MTNFLTVKIYDSFNRQPMRIIDKNDSSEISKWKFVSTDAQDDMSCHQIDGVTIIIKNKN